MEPHVLLLPYPSQGHLNPILQFAKRLVSKGVKATLAAPHSITRSIPPQVGSIALVTISDGYDAGGFEEASSIKDYLDRFEAEGSRTLADVVEKLAGAGQQVCCIVYDAFLPWALEVAKRLGLVGATFFTQSCAVCAIYYNLQSGALAVPAGVSSDGGATVSLAGLPSLEIPDLPSFLSLPGTYPAYLAMVLNQFRNLEKADWVFWNTFEQLESEVFMWLARLWRVRAVGPTLPSAYLGKQIEGDKEYGIDLWKPSGSAYMKWLDARATNSVVYVSFGSMAPLAKEQMEEIARGLQGSGKYFLWVLKGPEQSNLPDRFLEETKEKGLVVTWCTQLEVLAHLAVGCFVTHCGWNSTLEGLSLGVPMVGVPQWTDQPTNAKCLESVWGVGVRAKSDQREIVRREEVEFCLREVMEGERGVEIKRNSNKWSELAKEAVREGGSSDSSIKEFVRSLCLEPKN